MEVLVPCPVSYPFIMYPLSSIPPGRLGPGGREWYDSGRRRFHDGICRWGPTQNKRGGGGEGEFYRSSSHYLHRGRRRRHHHRRHRHRHHHRHRHRRRPVVGGFSCVEDSVRTGSPFVPGLCCRYSFPRTVCRSFSTTPGPVPVLTLS